MQETENFYSFICYMLKNNRHFQKRSVSFNKEEASHSHSSSSYTPRMLSGLTGQG